MRLLGASIFLVGIYGGLFATTLSAAPSDPGDAPSQVSPPSTGNGKKVQKASSTDLPAPPASGPKRFPQQSVAPLTDEQRHQQLLEQLRELYPKDPSEL